MARRREFAETQRGEIVVFLKTLPADAVIDAREGTATMPQGEGLLSVSTLYYQLEKIGLLRRVEAGRFRKTGDFETSSLGDIGIRVRGYLAAQKYKRQHIRRVRRCITRDDVGECTRPDHRELGQTVEYLRRRVKVLEARLRNYQTNERRRTAVLRLATTQ